MHLNPRAFNGLITDMGQQVTWRKAAVCPCKNPHSGASDPKCQHCGGKGGYLWAEPIDGVVGVTGSKTQREWAQSGNYETGDTVVSLPENSPLYLMGQADRVMLLNATEQFSLAHVRGDRKERLAGKVEVINEVFWFDQQKNIVRGSIPVLQDGTPTWADGGPPEGTQYTISGSRFQEFFCWGAFPSNRNMHQGARLPKRVVLRKFDLWGRGGG